MSENTLANSQRSTSACIDAAHQGDDYEGREEIERSWRQGLAPDPLWSLSEWADRHRWLSGKASAEPGRWRTSRTPYLREIMDTLSTMSPVQRIVFMKGAQIGATEVGLNWLGYIIHASPAPAMAVYPTVETAKRVSKQRIAPLIEESAVLRDRVKDARSRDSGNTVQSKEYPGGVMIFTGANSAVGLRSMPAQYLFLDEIDGYPGDVEEEGDPISLAERRSGTFPRRKIFMVSTPTVKGYSRVEREFDASDQRYFHVPCPHCHEHQILKFAQLHWPKGRPEAVGYACEHCGTLIEEHHKTWMLERGEWRATAEGDGRTRGYHLSSLYSPVGWFSWADAARMFQSAQDDTDLMKVFVNTVLGETFEEEHEVPDWRPLYERARRSDYSVGVVPDGALFLTAGADVQKDRIEVEVVGWGRGKRSWSIDYRVLKGDTRVADVWDQLREIIDHDWPTSSGGTMPIRVMAIDCGYHSQEVYDFVRPFPQPAYGPAGASAPHPRTVVAARGRDNNDRLIMPPAKVDPSSKTQSLLRWNIGTHVAKGELYRWLREEGPTDSELEEGVEYPGGWCEWPAEYGEDYFQQLTSERQVKRLVKGYPVLEWHLQGNMRNEALDCRVYARAAAAIFGIDLMQDGHWDRLERLAGGQPRSDQANAPQGQIGNRTRRRRVRSRFMSR